MNRLRLFLCLAIAIPAAACAGQAGSLPPVFYLSDSETGAAQLYRLPPGGAPRRLTGDETGGAAVVDFAPSPDGKRVAYAVTAGEDSAIRLIGSDGRGDTALLSCPAAECAGLVWSPDGRRLIYEQRPRENGRLGSPRLHWLDPGSGATLPLIEGNETPGYGARFSPDGAWISYVSPGDDGVVLYRIADGAQRLLTSRVGRPAAWSPDSREVIFSDIVVEGHETAPEGEGATPVQESASVWLYRIDVEGATGRALVSPQAGVDDGAAAWSPDGQWIAFGRAPAGTGAGRQLWLMRPDGSEARALTVDPAVTHGPPSWSPDGRYLLFQRVRLDDPAARPSVWVVNVASGEERLVADDGFLPAWGR